jgi:putative ABC transport system permease protein
MLKIMKLAIRNLLRYKRRSLLTGLLIAVGVVSVVVFVGLSDSFKGAVVGQITDSVFSHLQVHRKGYMASIDNLPLDRMIQPAAYLKLEDILKKAPGVEGFSPRIKFGSMLSDYAQTTNIRLNGIYPEKEDIAAPLLKTRIKNNQMDTIPLKKGQMLLPEVLAIGMGLRTGDTIVLVANNKDGSVNGMTFEVSGIVESLMGPGGRDGYVHIEDAAALLRMEGMEISEVAIRMNDFDRIGETESTLRNTLEPILNQQGKPAFELHTWSELSPFYNVVQMIDLMTLGIKVILIAVVLISVLNVMMMSVYERIREIGTLAAMGTSPGKIMGLFVAEGFSLGLASSIAGAVLGLAILLLLNITGVDVAFGTRNQIFSISPRIASWDVVSACLIVLLVSVLASLQPAAKAAKLEPVEALRHV